MTKQILALALAAGVVTAVACADRSPTAPTDESSLLNKNRRPAPIVQEVTGTLADGGTFRGTVTIQRFDTAGIVNGRRQLQVSGLLSGVATTIDGVAHDITGQAFSTTADLTADHETPGLSASMTVAMDAPTTASAQASAMQCGILALDLGPLHLDLLGLVVDLNEVILNVTGQTGAGQLLGNLLCALLGLLDPVAVIAALQNILNLVNSLLGGATPPAV